MKKEHFNKELSEYSSLNKEQLLEEIARMHAQIRKMEYTDTSYRPTVSVELDAAQGLFDRWRLLGRLHAPGAAAVC